MQLFTTGIVPYTTCLFCHVSYVVFELTINLENLFL